jgi:hypothetical protein
VLSSVQNAVRRNLACPSLSVSCSILLLLFSGRSAFGQATALRAPGGLDGAVHQLAERVSGIPNLRGPVRIEFFEDASSATETGKEWEEIFRKDLEKFRLNASEDAASNVLRIGLAETPTEVVLSAGVRLNENEEVRIVTLPRAAFHAASLPVVPVRIEKQLVFQSADGVLDATWFVESNSSGLLILGYRDTDLSLIKADSTGAIQQIVSLAPAGVRVARDLRGEVSAQSNEATVVLPGKTCQVGWATPGDAKCHNAKAAWRSTVVVASPCDAGDWKLRADGADWASPDLLQVVPEGALRKRSAALSSDFPGPILSVAGGGGGAALVVTRNLRTGTYEVYKIALACGN